MADFKKIIYQKVIEAGKLQVANEKGLNIAKIQKRCECHHKDINGGISLIPPVGGGRKNPITGAPYYTCKTCKSEIDISKISQEDFDKALDTIVRVIDIAKMRAQLESEKDIELFEEMGRNQYFLLGTMPDIFKYISKNDKKKKKKGNGGGLSSMYRVGGR